MALAYALKSKLAIRWCNQLGAMGFLGGKGSPAGVEQVNRWTQKWSVAATLSQPTEVDNNLCAWNGYNLQAEHRWPTDVGTCSTVAVEEEAVAEGWVPTVQVLPSWPRTEYREPRAQAPEPGTQKLQTEFCVST